MDGHFSLLKWIFEIFAERLEISSNLKTTNIPHITSVHHHTCNLFDDHYCLMFDVEEEEATAVNTIQRNTMKGKWHK